MTASPRRRARGHWRPALAAVAVSALSAAALGVGPARAVAPRSGVQDASAGDTRAQTEQTIAVSPTDPRNVIIGFFGGFVVSHDSGSHWKLTQIRCPNVDNNPAFDRHGVAYLECNSNGVTVWRSPDAGDTWLPSSNPVTNGDNQGDFPDRPWLVASPTQDRLVLGWESFFTNPLGWVFLKSSTDGAQTWSPAHQADDTITDPAQADPRQVPTVGGDGVVYVAYAVGHNPFAAPQLLPTDLVVARSADGGSTFTRAVAAHGIVRTTSPSEEAEAISSLAADPSPRRPGHVALAWADQRSGDSRILLATSTDGGRQWSAPVDIADDPAGRGVQHDHPQVRYAPDGRVIVLWRDHRCCGGGWSTAYQLWARPVVVTGARPAPARPVVQVTDGPQAVNSSTMFDEYLGLDVGPAGVSAAWNQPRGGVAASTFRRLPLDVFAMRSPAGLRARPHRRASAQHRTTRRHAGR